MSNQQQQQQEQRVNQHAVHGDRRVERAREKYGDIATLTLDQLQERAQQQGIPAAKSRTKEELMQILSGRGGDGGS